MEFTAKLFGWQGTGNLLIVLARGAMNAPDFTGLFRNVRAETQSLSQCKVLIDLTDSTYEIGREEIERLVAGLALDGWAERNKIAFVSTPEIIHYHRLYFLHSALAGRGLMVGVFRDTKVAVDWLTSIT